MSVRLQNCPNRLSLANCHSCTKYYGIQNAELWQYDAEIWKTILKISHPGNRNDNGFSRFSDRTASSTCETGSPRALEKQQSPQLQKSINWIELEIWSTNNCFLGGCCTKKNTRVHSLICWIKEINKKPKGWQLPLLDSSICFTVWSRGGEKAYCFILQIIAATLNEV